MKTRLVVASIAIILAVLLFANKAKGQPGGIILERADATSTLSIAASSPLNSLIANVGQRFVVEYANSLKYYGLTPPPTDLQILVGQVSDRFILQYANANVIKPLTYPVNLVGDNLAPQISALSANGYGVVQWNTDEFTTAQVRYGTQPGAYPHAISDTLFYKLHQITLANLTPGTTYYYQVSCTDRSGNTTESIEYSFTASQHIFIPMVRR